jgi:ssDNA-binding Zn-finger/Zn-ribbon topoisomerase 1
MVSRKGPKGPFWGCASFPRCRGTLNIGSGSVSGVPVDQIKLLKGSPEQEKIWDLMRSSESHIVVKALAGCGKTTTLIQGLARIDLRKVHSAYLAFNNSIRDEMMVRAPQGCTVVGLHQFGKRAFGARFPSHVVDNNKYSTIFDQLCPFTGKSKSDEATIHGLNAMITQNMVAKCQNFLLQGVVEDLDWVVDHFAIEFENEEGFQADRELVYRLVPQMLEIGKNTTSCISFDDMLWMPVVHGLPTPTFDLVCIDEAQDLNGVQHALVMSSIRTGGRAVVVGDENQAIYGFRGCDSDSIDTLGNLLSMTTRKVEICPLTETRRCGQIIVKEAQEFVPSFRAHPSNCEGEIINSQGIDDCLNSGYFVPGNMGICRFNAPIVKLAYRMISERIPVHFIGRDFGRTILTQAKKFVEKTVVEMSEKARKWKNSQLESLENQARMGKDVEAKQRLISDKANSVMIFIDEIMQRNVEIEIDNRTAEEEGKKKTPLLTPADVIAEIQSFFALNNGQSDEEHAKGGCNKFRLSSVHQAKGLEAETIIWVNPAATIKPKREWMAQQEKNLKYVAITRAIKRLVKMTMPKEV